MNNPQNNDTKSSRNLLPFFVEFIKFSAGFAAIIALSLIALRLALAAQ